MAQISKFDQDTCLIHTLELELSVFPMLGSHAFAMFAAPVFVIYTTDFNYIGVVGAVLYYNLCMGISNFKL